VVDRARTLAEAWLEDESLRGDLDDQTWRPIQDWLLGVADRIARSTAGQDDRAAQLVLEQVSHQARAVARILTRALASDLPARELSRVFDLPAGQLQPPLIERPRLPAVRAALQATLAAQTRHTSDRPTLAGHLTAALDTGLSQLPAERRA
jgi:hypothetical protein